VSESENAKAFEFSDLGLGKFEKALKNADPLKVKVGIIGDSASRSDSAMNNAEIGATHEFGTENLPERSFLRMPLVAKFREYAESSPYFKDKAIKDAVKNGTLLNLFLQMGILSEEIIQEAFDSAGFGKWTPSDMTKKQTKQTLVETTQLRKSIHSEVIK
jgi:hypothetical protein